MTAHGSGSHMNMGTPHSHIGNLPTGNKDGRKRVGAWPTVNIRVGIKKIEPTSLSVPLSMYVLINSKASLTSPP